MTLLTQSNLSANERERIASPVVPMAARIGRYMGARKRAWKSPERRTFPSFYHGMTTADYVRFYYRDNGLDGRVNGYDTMRYPDSFIAPIARPAPFYTGEAIEEAA